MSNRIEDRCLKAGVRLTDQRKLVAKVMSESEDHPDVDELHKRVSKFDSNLNTSKVSLVRLISLNSILLFFNRFLSILQ